MTTQSEPSNHVMVELRPADLTESATVDQLAEGLQGFAADPDFEPVPMASGPEGEAPTVIIRGAVEDPDQIEQLASDPRVVRVWRDTPTAPIDPSDLAI